MGSISSPSIVFSLVLILVLLPSGHASEYRMNKPESTNTPSNDAPAYTQEDFNPVDEAPAYTQDDYNPVDESPVYTPTLPAGENKPPNGPQQSYSSNSLIALFLAGQNAARAAFGLPPFQWDSNLAAYAQNYANQRINDCQLIHSNGPYGENIFWGSGDTDWSPAQAVDSWVQERQYYDYYSNSCMNGDDCGHYTQIVWKDSTRIGCAKVTCNGGLGQFITCNYDPPGNYIGTRPY